MLAKKPTRFITHSRSIGHELKKKCDGGHERQPLLDGNGKGRSPISPGFMSSHLPGSGKGEDAEAIGDQGSDGGG